MNTKYQRVAGASCGRPPATRAVAFDREDLLEETVLLSSSSSTHSFWLRCMGCSWRRSSRTRSSRARGRGDSAGRQGLGRPHRNRLRRASTLTSPGARSGSPSPRWAWAHWASRPSPRELVKLTEADLGRSRRLRERYVDRDHHERQDDAYDQQLPQNLALPYGCTGSCSWRA